MAKKFVECKLCRFRNWICKGDLNKHYDGNRDPIQSFLFCIKATSGVIRERQKLVSDIGFQWLLSLICLEKHSPLLALIEGLFFSRPS